MEGVEQKFDTGIESTDSIETEKALLSREEMMEKAEQNVTEAFFKRMEEQGKVAVLGVHVEKIKEHGVEKER